MPNELRKTKIKYHLFYIVTDLHTLYTIVVKNLQILYIKLITKVLILLKSIITDLIKNKFTHHV